MIVSIILSTESGMRLHQNYGINPKSMIIWGAYGSYGGWEDPQEEVGNFRHGI